MRTALLVILAVAAGPLHAASFSLGAQAGFQLAGSSSPIWVMFIAGSRRRTSVR